MGLSMRVAPPDALQMMIAQLDTTATRPTLALSKRIMATPVVTRINALRAFALMAIAAIPAAVAPATAAM